MKSLNETIADIMATKESRKKKQSELKKLGLTNVDIFYIFKAVELASKYPDFGEYTIGVEIECFNVYYMSLINKLSEAGIVCQRESYNHSTRQHYKIVSDGSITGANPAEIVSPILKDFKTLEKVCEALNSINAETNRSCGLHIHVGLQNIDFPHYKRIISNYINSERVIDAMMPRSRRDNRYCKSFGRITDNRVMSCNSHEEVANLFEQDRYYKVNPMSYAHHNTLEFRQHNGTINFTKINHWVKFILSLVEWSKDNVMMRQASVIDELDYLNDELKAYYTDRIRLLAM